MRNAQHALQNGWIWRVNHPPWTRWPHTLRRPCIDATYLSSAIISIYINITYLLWLQYIFYFYFHNEHWTPSYNLCIGPCQFQHFPLQSCGKKDRSAELLPTSYDFRKELRVALQDAWGKWSIVNHCFPPVRRSHERNPSNPTFKGCCNVCFVETVVMNWCCIRFKNWHLQITWFQRFNVCFKSCPSDAKTKVSVGGKSSTFAQKSWA